MKQQLIKEIKLLNEELAKPEANADDVFGQYLGAEKRNDVPVPQEKNTRPENSFIYSLSAYIDGEENELDEFSSKIKTLLAQNKYSTFLKPVGDTAFRMLYNVTVKTASQFLKIDQEFLLKNSEYTFDGAGGVYNHRGSDLSSWSTQITPDLARNLGNTQGEIYPDSCLVILVAPIQSNNFVLNWKSLSNAPFIPDYVRTTLVQEKEVIGIGPIHYEESWAFVNKTKKRISAIEIIKHF